MRSGARSRSAASWTPTVTCWIRSTGNTSTSAASRSGASLPNTVTRYQTNSGGGWGDPLAREPERVLRDVRNEYVSREAAADVYGVVVVDGDPDTDPEAMRVDEAATTALRQERAGA